MTASIDEVVAAAEAAGVRLVRFEYCDLSGVSRTKAVTTAQLRSAMREGISFTRAQNAINLLEDLLPIEGLEPVGDVRLVPDPATWSVLPWEPRTASMMGDQLAPEGGDYGGCPRLFLKRMIERAEQAGLAFDAAFENEFYLVREVDGRYVPFDAPFHSPCYSPIGQDHGAAVLLDMIDALDAQGLQVESAINEYGPGQYEIAIRYADALAAADHQMKVRDTLRGVALQHGLLASLAPKPFPAQIGSGCHIHWSVRDTADGRPLLLDSGQPGSLSALGRHAIAGVAEHLPALAALTTPSANSFRRLAPGAWSSATTAWGFENKEAALRVCGPLPGREDSSLNIELKASDASANPYLALGGLIACALDGIARELDPGAPVQADPALATSAQLEAGRVRPLPGTMDAALDALESDALLVDALGDPLARFYLAVRRSEAAAFADGDVDLEIRHHLYRF